MRPVGRSVALIGVAMLLVFVSAAAALAHAKYKSSDPADESTVPSPPSQITAEFTEPMASGSYMDVTDPCGRDSGSGSSQTGSSMSVQNSSTAAGTYVVFWRAVSIDSHPTEGEFTFTSSGGDACPGEEEEKEPGGGGGDRGGSDGGDSGRSGGGADSEAESAGRASSGHEGRSKGQHGKHGRAVKESDRKARSGGSGNRAATGPLAEARSDVPDAPSALEGIPLTGLLMTLGVSVLIGAAAGKIYVSLSGDES